MSDQSPFSRGARCWSPKLIGIGLLAGAVFTMNQSALAQSVPTDQRARINQDNSGGTNSQSGQNYRSQQGGQPGQGGQPNQGGQSSTGQTRQTRQPASGGGAGRTARGSAANMYSGGQSATGVQPQTSSRSDCFHGFQPENSAIGFHLCEPQTSGAGGFHQFQGPGSDSAGFHQLQPSGDTSGFHQFQSNNAGGSMGSPGGGGTLRRSTATDYTREPLPGQGASGGGTPGNQSNASASGMSNSMGAVGGIPTNSMGAAGGMPTDPTGLSSGMPTDPMGNGSVMPPLPSQIQVPGLVEPGM